MIRTSMQLKARVRNLSGGDSRKSQTLIRNFIMERFLERIVCDVCGNTFGSNKTLSLIQCQYTYQ